jgi:surface polysaccharide O-acyltransferase-like enzyme
MESGKINSVAGDSIARTLSDSVLAAGPAVVSRGYRIANIERLRILSAAAIVCFHTCGDLSIARHLGTVGILVFLISLCAFVVNRPEPLDPAIAIKRKARRLLKPWLFWSMVYGILPLLKVFHRDVPFSDAFSWTMLVTGTRIHLWFLPFAFAAALLLVLIHRALADVSNPHIVTTAIVMGALSVFGFSIVQSCLQPPTPVRQWILGAPAIVLGLAVGRITLQHKTEDRRNLYLLTILSPLAAYAALAWLFSGSWLDYAGTFAFRYCASVAVICFALQRQGTMDPISKKLASLSYGIYLVHPLVMVFLAEFGVPVRHPLLLLSLVLLISAVITDVLKRLPFMKQFV